MLALHPQLPSISSNVARRRIEQGQCVDLSTRSISSQGCRNPCQQLLAPMITDKYSPKLNYFSENSCGAIFRVIIIIPTSRIQQPKNYLCNAKHQSNPIRYKNVVILNGEAVNAPKEGVGRHHDHRPKVDRGRAFSLKDGDNRRQRCCVEKYQIQVDRNTDHELHVSVVYWYETRRG